MWRRIALTVLVGFSVFVIGCAQAELEQLRAHRSNLQEQLGRIEAEKGRLSNSIEMLRAQNRDLQAKMGELQEQNRRMGGAIAEYEQRENRQKKQYEELQRLVQDLAGITAETGPEGNFIRLEAEVLFAPGKATLVEEAKKALNSIADSLKRKRGQKLRIDGHTDGVPITHSDWDDNYHLAAMRANAVRRYLASKGVQEENMYVVGFGPNEPRVPPANKTAPEPANRRVEILLVPEEIEGVENILKELKG